MSIRAVLEQLETEGGDLLLFAAISGQDTLAAIAEKLLAAFQRSTTFKPACTS